jgi:hypothetical protein
MYQRSTGNQKGSQFNWIFDRQNTHTKTPPEISEHNFTGRFPKRSSKVNWYIIVVYSFECNYIKPTEMKTKSASEWLKSFGGIFQELSSHGFNPKLQTMDNEASAALKSYFMENYMTYQLVPPHCHRLYAAERTIR